MSCKKTSRRNAPDEMRGRGSAINSLFIGTSNELGGYESGLVAEYFGTVFSVVSGCIGTLVVVVIVGIVWPQLQKYGALVAEAKEWAFADLGTIYIPKAT
jgi:hypothetical protein